MYIAQDLLRVRMGNKKKKLKCVINQVHVEFLNLKIKNKKSLKRAQS